MSLVDIELSQPQARENSQQESQIWQIRGIPHDTTEQVINDSSRSQAETDGIGQRVQLLSNIGFHIQKASDHAIEEIKHSSQQDINRRPNKITLERHHHRNAPTGHVHACDGIGNMLLYTHFVFNFAITVWLPTTFCFKFTKISASFGRNMSTREPNLMKPIC